MSVREAILQVLEEEKRPITASEICSKIISKKYHVFGSTNPENIVNKIAGEFIRKNDARVRRTRKDGIGYLYYLKEYEYEDIDAIIYNADTIAIQKVNTYNEFKECDLHKLFSTYLKSQGIYSKTIDHRKTGKKDDEFLKWIHPDMVGVELIDLHKDSSKNFLKTINIKEMFKLSSYELKVRIKNDAELKQAYFQAVSNSSWANYGYLVAFEIDDKVIEEIKRLNESFGIGVIKLGPYESEIICHSRLRDLDIKTIDKLCRNNPDFDDFIIQIENLLRIDVKNYSIIRSTFENSICDECFLSDNDITLYCKEKNIPIEDELSD